MTITYAEFKKRYPIGKDVASPEGLFRGECVSYVRQYMLQVHGFSSGPLGHAINIPDNKTFLSAYKKVSSPRVGDLMFWGDDAGNWTGIHGHTAIYDGNGMMYNQNYNGSRVISKNPIFTPGFKGYYRPKGFKMERTALKRLIKAMQNRDVNADDEKKYLGKDPNDVIIEIDNWDIENGRSYSQTVDRLEKQIDDLENQSFEPVTETLYRKK